jgi:hypothetical protein
MQARALMGHLAAAVVVAGLQHLRLPSTVAQEAQPTDTPTSREVRRAVVQTAIRAAMAATGQQSLRCQPVVLAAVERLDRRTRLAASVAMVAFMVAAAAAAVRL